MTALEIVYFALGGAGTAVFAGAIVLLARSSRPSPDHRSAATAVVVQPPDAATSTAAAS